MKKFIPLELSLAERLAKVQLSTPFCGFCRAERDAVEELKAVVAALPNATGKVEIYLGRTPELEFSEPPIPPMAGKWERGFSEPEYAHLRQALADYQAEDTPCAWDDLAAQAATHLPDLLADLDQAQATIKEMGELIDEKTTMVEYYAAELGRMKRNLNYLVEGCTCRRARGLERLYVEESGATHTHKTKGGHYRILGKAKPAGELKQVVPGQELNVYQDVFTGQIYVRTADFHTSLEPL